MQGHTIARMRTLDEAYAALLSIDPQTSVSKNFIRKLALTNKIPVVMAGRKRLLNFDALLDYLNSGCIATDSAPVAHGAIRRAGQ